MILKKKRSREEASVSDSPVSKSAQSLHMLNTLLRGLFFLCLICLFFAHPTWYHLKNGSLDLRAILVVAGGSLLGTLLPHFWVSLAWPDWLRRAELVILVIAGPLCIFQLVEYIHGNAITSYSKEFILYNYLLILSFCLAAYIICNRIRPSIFVAFLFLMIFSIVNFYVFDFRGEPILAADIYDIETAAGVAGAYQFTISWRTFWALFSIPSFWAVLSMIPGEKWHPRKLTRIAAILIAATLSGFCFHLFAMTNYMTDRGNKLKMFESYRSYQKYGETLTMVWSFRYILVDKPLGYSASQLQNTVAREYTSDPLTTVSEVTEETPNIIFIMNESFADFDSLGDLGANKDPIPFIHSLKGQDNVIWGNLYTEGYGGKTANTEYEIMTGNSMSFLPNACVAYTVFVKNELPTLNWNLRDMGYSGCYGYHPYKASGYRRNTVYPMLGFQNTLFLEDMEDELTEDDYIRGYVTDSADYKWLIRAYEETRQESDAPFYMYNVTMQNHGSYTLTDDKMDMSITMRKDLASNKKSNLYINLLPYTDAALQELTEYFENVDEPTILVFFGDHQPGLGTDFLSELTGLDSFSGKNIFQKYQVPIIIWGNYDINPGGIHDQEFETLSTNYLGVKLMNMLGYPMTAYQKYLLDLSEDLPIISLHGHLTADGTFIKEDATDSEYADRINEYNALVYNFQIDSKHRLKDFFTLGGVSDEDHKVAQ